MAARNVGPIQAAPEGLLSLLGLKQLGENPSELAGVVQPGLDLRDWYLSSTLEWLSGVTANVNAAQNWYFGITVPAGEIWYVHSIHARANMVAAEVLNAAIGFAYDRGLAQPPLHILTGQTLASGTKTLPTIVEFGCQPRMFLPANVTFGANVYTVTTAAAIELSSEVLITRLRR